MIDGEIGPPPDEPVPAPQVRDVPVWCAVVAVVVALAAAIGALLWWQERSRVILSLSATAPAQAAHIDASGCPVGARCETRAEATKELAAAVQRVFPTALVLETGSRVVSASGRVVRTTTVLQTLDAVVVSIAVQCEPGATTVTERGGSLATKGPSDDLLVVAGSPGCSVAVVAHTPAGVSVPIRQLAKIAGDPAVQLRP